MTTAIILLFVIGYLLITLEHSVQINKAATALITGVGVWTIYALSGLTDIHTVIHDLEVHMSEIAGITYFLIGAMVIVELVDAHDGFELITARIKTTDKRKLMVILSLITFFLSALLDNLTTTIVMVSLVRKLIADRETRLMFIGMIVISANAGGAWSPLGDVTTTMLWIGNQITAFNIMKALIIPSLVCLAVPLLLVAMRAKGDINPTEEALHDPTDGLQSPELEQKLVFGVGVGVLLMVPVFKTVTHLPPYMGMLLGLGLIWAITELIHRKKDEREKGERSVLHALRKADTPSILFFLGILLAVAALQASGILANTANWLSQNISDERLLVLLIGMLSAVVDNVPLVAAVQAMYPLSQYPTDHFFWEYLAYCTGTGGSILIIGSAAGVAAMGLENITFGWYLKRIALWALIGYLAGALTFVLLS